MSGLAFGVCFTLTKVFSLFLSCLALDSFSSELTLEGLLGGL